MIWTNNCFPPPFSNYSLWIPLLKKSLFLFNNKDQPCVSLELTMNILRNLQELILSHKRKDFIKEVSSSLKNNDIVTIREALSHNVNHCIVFEGSKH